MANFCKFGVSISTSVPSGKEADRTGNSPPGASHHVLVTLRCVAMSTGDSVHPPLGLTQQNQPWAMEHSPLELQGNISRGNVCGNRT